MFTRSVRRTLVVLFAGAAFSAASLSAKISEWSDRQGTRFRGEPTEILGPFALFRTSSGGGKRVLLRGLPTEEILRLQLELADKPPLALRWSDARGTATARLPGHTSRVVNKKLELVSVADLPEPELLLVLAGAPNNSQSWLMVENMKPLFHRLERVLQGRFATVFIGVPQTEIDHQRFVVDSGMPWLIADRKARSSLGVIARLIPKEGSAMYVLSREGTPLLSTDAADLAAIKKFTDDLLELTWSIDAENQRSWPDRAYYLGLVRPVEFAESSTGPLFIGNPLVVEGLRRRGVQRISAQIEVAANGSVTGVSLKPDGIFPAAVAANLTTALRHLQFLPAIDRGTPVAGTTDYVLNLPVEDPTAAADAMWLGAARIELPIPDWLVLRPIHVPESDFGEIDHVDETGKVVMKALEVSKDRVSRQLQRTAFNSDWFGSDGAGSVRPIEGEVQPVDEERPVWRKIAAVDGLVNLATGFGNSDFCVGYAWTEIDIPADIDAWLGIGSDDGLKIWHNGTLVVDRWVRRPSRLDDDIVPLHLTKGKNQLLIKIQNMTIEWSFISRLRTRK